MIFIGLSSCSLNYQIKQANKRYDIGEYSAATPRYKRILSRIPRKEKQLKAEIATKLGHCYRFLSDNRRAEAAYRQALRFESHPQDSTFFLHYADVQRENENYKAAAKNYHRFLLLDSTNVWAKNGLLSCDSARLWKKLPQRFSVKKCDYLNSRKSSDFSPVVMNDDGSLILFTSSRVAKGVKGIKNSKITGQRNNDLYTVRRNNKGKWEEAVLLPEGVINTDMDEGVACLGSDGKTIYYTVCRSIPGETHGAEIYYSKRSGNDYSEPKQLIFFKDSTVTIAHPAMSPGGEYLYFVSDHFSGYGGKDIWRVSKKTEEEWNEPENLGPSINTSGDEMFPTFRYDGTLFFSSNGHKGLGGLDIFEAHAMQITEDSTVWSVRNLMQPINSSSDDFSLSFVGRTNNGYFSSNRKDPKGRDKIYYFGEPVVEFALKGEVTDYRGNPLPEATIRIVGDDGTNKKLITKKDGTYSFPLNKQVNYVILASAKGHLNQYSDFSTVNVYKTQTYTKDFSLPSMGQPVRVDNIFFDFGKHTLTSDSESGLKVLVKMLTDNPHVTIEISAHTDHVGSDEFNMKLSQRRAQSVVDYLIENGIDAERLQSQGWGESKPVVVTEEMAKEHAFLKEGQSLDESFVMTLTEQEREIVTQINRRIEFVVLKTTYKMY